MRIISGTPKKGIDLTEGGGVTIRLPGLEFANCSSRVSASSRMLNSVRREVRGQGLLTHPGLHTRDEGVHFACFHVFMFFMIS